MAEQEFSVKFWGVRGSIPSPGPNTAMYGGNTPCIEITCGDRCLIFDAGSGIRAFGNQLVDQARHQNLDLFFTHCHYDHIEGLPFFAPLHDDRFKLTMWSGHRLEPDTRQMVEQYMQKPYFPVGPACFRANINYREFAAADQIELSGGITILTMALTHPDGAIGYRIKFGGRSICYVTDTEHFPGRLDQNILKFIQDADIVIYDAAYDDDDFDKFAGYGHSTWQEGRRLCDAANVGLYVAFHHRPSADDEQLRKVETALKALRPSSVLAREGLILTA